MVDKKTYYKLDDIGFVGTQQERSAISRKADAKKTSSFINTKKSAKVFPIPRSVRIKAVK